VAGSDQRAEQPPPYEVAGRGVIRALEEAGYIVIPRQYYELLRRMAYSEPAASSGSWGPRSDPLGPDSP
jgi:hypothetical protein